MWLEQKELKNLLIFVDLKMLTGLVFLYIFMLVEWRIKDLMNQNPFESANF